jgi:hypothetical protein
MMMQFGLNAKNKLTAAAALVVPVFAQCFGITNWISEEIHRAGKPKTHKQGVTCIIRRLTQTGHM